MLVAPATAQATTKESVDEEEVDVDDEDRQRWCRDAIA
jgi:hypothetical protein